MQTFLKNYAYKNAQNHPSCKRRVIFALKLFKLMHEKSAQELGLKPG